MVLGCIINCCFEALYHYSRFLCKPTQQQEGETNLRLVPFPGQIYNRKLLDLLSNTYSVPSFQRQPHIKNHSTKVLLKQSYVKVYPYILFNIIMQQMQKLSLKKKLTHPVTFVSNCPFTSTYTYN